MGIGRSFRALPRRRGVRPAEASLRHFVLQRVYSLVGGPESRLAETRAGVVDPGELGMDRVDCEDLGVGGGCSGLAGVYLLFYRNVMGVRIPRGGQAEFFAGSGGGSWPRRRASSRSYAHWFTRMVRG